MKSPNTPPLSILKSYTFLFVLLVILFASCKPQDPWKEKFSGISSQVIDWNQRYEHHNARIDSLWDITSDVLAQQLPEDFPAIDRDIFIHSRNASHIRMFMSFQQLEPSLQSMVNEAGEKDILFATEMRQLQKERHVLEEQIASFLFQVGQDDPVLVKQYQVQFPQLAGLATN